MSGRRYLFSGSMLPLVGKCAPAGVLPRVARIGDRDRMGSALHEHARDRLVLGLDGALARLPEVAAAWHLDETEESIFRARAYGFEWTPPRGALPEIALCLCEDGRVEIVKGGRGQYEDLPADALIPTQIDIFWAEPEPLYRDASGAVRCPPTSVLYVGDYKSGQEKYVDNVERNLQTLLGCVLAAKLTGARYAVPAIIYWRKGKGLWDVPPVPLDEAGLKLAEEGIRAIHARARDAGARLAAGEPVQYVTGTHCDFCDSSTYCPAKLAPLKRWLGVVDPLSLAQLTREQMVELAPLLAQADAFARLLRAGMTAWTKEHGAFEVAPGKHWGPHVQPTQSLDADKAIAALADEIGPEAAQEAVKREVSKAAVEAAIAQAHKRSGIMRQKSAAMRRFLGRMRATGGIVEGRKIVYGLHAADVSVDPTAITVASYQPGDEEIDGDD